ncbi:MAG: serine/threonine protein kinase [Rubrivivax sp.]|nr:serine/threonine protein kinase [Rubrivivax sp.]
MNNATQSFLGRYRLVKVLGQGAMGVVYEAVDTRLNRTVAIKTVLRSHMADETTASEYASRFEREAQAAARLAHPHVVTVHDFGEHEDISYIVMEFVRGRELNHAFEAGESFALSEAIRIMRELLAALDYAHQQGIVHRDIKPANVMLDQAGHVKLTDFGVARVASATQDRTMPGTLVGTPSYMSPEQILGLAVGSRADIFAAGVILYQFLTGKRPFSGGGPFGVQRKIVQDDPEPPSVANPKLPAGFDLIVARALAKQPEDRYETAAAFAHDLERIGSTLPRELPHIDLDFSAAPPPPVATTRAAPAATAPAPVGLTLKADLSAPAPAVPPPPPSDGGSQRPPPDPEATVIMARPSAPEAPVTQPARRPPAPPVAAPTVQRPPVASAAAAASPAPAPRPPAAPKLPPAPIGTRPARPPAAPRPMPPPPRQAAVSNATRRTLLPLAAGAAVAVLALATWLLMGKPTRAPAEAAAPTQTAPPSPAAPPAAAPAAPPVMPSVTPPAPSPPIVAPTVVEAAVPAAPKATPTPVPAAAAPAPEPTRRPTAERAPRPAAAPAARPAATERSEPRGAAEPRCIDLLQRMQLGEPLTPDQTQYFQTRCTR